MGPHSLKKSIPSILELPENAEALTQRLDALAHTNKFIFLQFQLAK
jgi:hypothetical protein